MTNDARLKIASSGLSAKISTFGAELQDLCDAEGRSLQWDGDPAVWTGRAPLLFPIVGMLRDGRYRLDGREYAMPKHGFARHSTFDVVAHEQSRAVLRLTANDATRAVYPFEFALELAYALDGSKLAITATIENLGSVPMPASFGFHPALRWPLPYGEPRAGHGIRFQHAEPAPIRRIDASGLLTADPRPTPVVGDVLHLDDALFDDDAVIFDALTSRRLSYGATRGPRLLFDFDAPRLGVWTKPGGAQFICIEPWHGVADPVGFDGDLWQKPGIVAVQPGQPRTFALAISLDSATAAT